MTDIKSQTLSGLMKEMERLGEPKFRAKQIYSWMHGKLADSFEEMTDLPGNFVKNCSRNMNGSAWSR